VPLLGTLATSRTRTQTLSSKTYNWSFTKTAGGSGTTSGSYTDSETIETRDTETPGWRKLINDGQIVNNDYWSQTIKESSSGPTNFYVSQTNVIGGLAYTYEGDRTPYYWCNSVPFLDTSINVTNLRNRVISGLFAKANDPDALALVMLAEAQKTSSMILTILERVRFYTKTYNKRKQRIIRRFGSIGKASAALASLWLEYRYGIRPLAFEMKNLVEAIQNTGSLKRATIRYGGNEFETDNDIADSGLVSSNYSLDIARSCSFAVSITGGALLDINGPVKRTFADTAGLDNILSTSWELVPYSFVIDWFCNMGDVIASWEPTGARLLTSWLSLKGQKIALNKLGSDPYDLAHETRPWEVEAYALAIGDPYVMRTTTYREREADPSKPILPAIDVNLDLGKILDAIALLRNLR